MSDRDDDDAKMIMALEAEIESLKANIAGLEASNSQLLNDYLGSCDEIESLQARIEQLEPFERLAKMSGQNIGLRLMDAEARIEELETDIMAYKKHFGQPVGSDSRETWKEKYKKAQARIAELEEENKQMKYDLNEGYTGYKPPEE